MFATFVLVFNNKIHFDIFKAFILKWMLWKQEKFSKQEINNAKQKKKH